MSSKKNNSKRRTARPIRPLAVPPVVFQAYRRALGDLIENVHYERSDDEVCLTARNHDAMDSILDRLAEVAPPCACGSPDCHPAQSLASLKEARWTRSDLDVGPVWVCGEYLHLHVARQMATFLAGALHGVRAA